LQDTLQHLLNQLSDLRARLAHARTTDEVLGTLGAGLVPTWADGLRIVVRGSARPVSSVGSLDEDRRAEPLPPELWDSASPAMIWLCTDPSRSAEVAGWTALDPGAGVADLPAAWRVAMPVDSMGEPAALVLERTPERAAWAASELWVVNECVRLVEFALRTVQQHRRTLEARAIADAAAHRWSAFARLSSRLVRAVNFDDVATSIVAAVVPYLADWALLDVVTPGGEVRRIRHRHAHPGRQRLLEPITTFPSGPGAMAEAVERLGREGWLIPRVSPEDLRRLAGADEHAALERLAPRSVAVVPLVAGEQLRGALTLATASSGQQYGPEDLALFRSLAHQAALALNSAQLYGDAERARMEREEVLAIVSHDLKNPLNTLGFALTILAQEGIAEESKALQFGIMQRAMGQMNELVRDLLDTARIDAGRFSVSPAPQDAAALVREALLHAAPLAKQARVRLENAVVHDPPPVLADRQRIMQVFANLIDNAISFTPAQGRVRLSVSVREMEVDFEVEDSGPGLDPEVAEHVFDRFWQARHTGRAGAGLGLAIARGIVEAHGGEIGVRSEPGRGAVFHFSVPRAPV
jgi:signal transduction histidine kinase